MIAPQPVPFASAEEAWLWTCRALKRRRGDDVPQASGPARPCGPEDVLRVVDTLYRRRRIDAGHAQVMRYWAERGSAPPSDTGNGRLWQQAMDRLTPHLRDRGIIA